MLGSFDFMSTNNQPPEINPSGGQARRENCDHISDCGPGDDTEPGDGAEPGSDFSLWKNVFIDPDRKVGYCSLS